MLVWVCLYILIFWWSWAICLYILLELSTKGELFKPIYCVEQVFDWDVLWNQLLHRVEWKKCCLSYKAFPVFLVCFQHVKGSCANGSMISISACDFLRILYNNLEKPLLQVCRKLFPHVFRYLYCFWLQSLEGRNYWHSWVSVKSCWHNGWCKFEYIFLMVPFD